ncbi:MAG: hypothetical protein HeimC2_23450 [Candidatus Heimdallarchaeota archaeon LC_2]|nr:MAG: hypothetical protein HeimC2_23450 [Candidatus Heimdallarchaeota archaeon LC_2]
MMRSTLIFCMFVLMILFPSNTSLASEEGFPVISNDGKYHIQIVMYQWQFDVYNLQGNESIEEAIDEGKHIASSGPKSSVGPFLINTGIIFEVYSQDVQHGFSIPELDLALAASRVTPGNKLGFEVIAESILPSDPVTMKSFCYIFCGLGHPDEHLDFVVVANLDDYNTTESENLQIPVLILPIIFSLTVIINFTKKLRLLN